MIHQMERMVIENGSEDCSGGNRELLQETATCKF